MKSSIVDSIKSLPPLSKTIAEINRVYNDENSSISDMAKAIDHDPMIIANLLKAASSPLYGFSKDIKNASQAVGLFGMAMTRSLALANAVRKLLNVDLQPYGINSEAFAEISMTQATLVFNWYSKIDKKKAEKLYLAAFLQETGKILIASDIIQDDETYSFKSAIELSLNIAQVEREYVEVSSAEVTALVFEHWGFEQDMIDMIRYSDDPKNAPESIAEYAQALNIVKTAIPVNKPLSEQSINSALIKADAAKYNHEILEDSIDDLLESM